MLWNVCFCLFGSLQLYGEFADHFRLSECKLAIIHCAGHSDPILVNSLWQEVIEKGNIPITVSFYTLLSLLLMVVLCFRIKWQCCHESGRPDESSESKARVAGKTVRWNTTILSFRYDYSLLCLCLKSTVLTSQVCHCFPGDHMTWCDTCVSSKSFLYLHLCIWKMFNLKLQYIQAYVLLACVFPWKLIPWPLHYWHHK